MVEIRQGNVHGFRSRTLQHSVRRQCVLGKVGQVAAGRILRDDQVAHADHPGEGESMVGDLST